MGDLKTVTFLFHVDQPAMETHLSCKDVFSVILRHPFKQVLL